MLLNSRMKNKKGIIPEDLRIPAEIIAEKMNLEYSQVIHAARTGNLAALHRAFCRRNPKAEQSFEHFTQTYDQLEKFLLQGSKKKRDHNDTLMKFMLGKAKAEGLNA